MSELQKEFAAVLRLWARLIIKLEWGRMSHSLPNLDRSLIHIWKGTNYKQLCTCGDSPAALFVLGWVLLNSNCYMPMHGREAFSIVRGIILESTKLQKPMPFKWEILLKNIAFFFYFIFFSRGNMPEITSWPEKFEIPSWVAHAENLEKCFSWQSSVKSWLLWITFEPSGFSVHEYTCWVSPLTQPYIMILPHIL